MHRCQVLKILSDDRIFVHLFDEDVAIIVDIDKLRDLDQEFFSGKYASAFVVPGYTVGELLRRLAGLSAWFLGKNLLNSIGLPHPTELNPGRVVDVMVLDVGERFLMLLCPHTVPFTAFRAPRLVQDMDEKSAAAWTQLFSRRRSLQKSGMSVYEQLKHEQLDGENFGLVCGLHSLEKVYVRNLGE